jgi:hypothetical protein
MDTKHDTDMNIPFHTSITPRSLMRRRQYRQLTPEEVTQRLFTDFVNVHLDRWKKKGVQAKAEETVVELFRQGVPKSAVTFCFSYLAVSLAHATYYLYRTEPARGTVEVNWNEFKSTVTPTVRSKDLAEAILRMDAEIPALEARVKEFLDRMAVELKAEEIMRITVGAQLEAVMPALGLGCTFDVKDDKVQLDLTRQFHGRVVLPVSELQAFLADPNRILGLLQPGQDGYVEVETQ